MRPFLQQAASVLNAFDKASAEVTEIISYRVIADDEQKIDLDFPCVSGGPVVDFPGKGGLRIRVRSIEFKQAEVICSGIITSDDTVDSAPLHHFALPCRIEIMRAISEVLLAG